MHYLIYESLVVKMVITASVEIVRANYMPSTLGCNIIARDTLSDYSDLCKSLNLIRTQL